MLRQTKLQKQNRERFLKNQKDVMFVSRQKWAKQLFRKVGRQITKRYSNQEKTKTRFQDSICKKIFWLLIITLYTILLSLKMLSQVNARGPFQYIF